MGYIVNGKYVENRTPNQIEDDKAYDFFDICLTFVYVIGFAGAITLGSLAYNHFKTDNKPEEPKAKIEAVDHTPVKVLDNIQNE